MKPTLWILAFITLSTDPHPIAAECNVQRIRPSGDYERTLLTDGLSRSYTFRRLVERLHESDVIVHVMARPVRAALSIDGGLQFLGATTTDRIVRVVLFRNIDHERMIAMLGHELQHAVEVANAPELRSQRALDAYYRLHGVRGDLGQDTSEAREVEWKIRTEVGSRSKMHREVVQPGCEPATTLGPRGVTQFSGERRTK